MDLDILLACHDCPNIVQCYGYFIKDTEVWICMELMTTCFDKLLKKFKRPIPEPILGKISVAVSVVSLVFAYRSTQLTVDSYVLCPEQTVKALNYLKDIHGVIHRDVKPSNILINENGVVKLCDFGISGRLVDSKAKTRSAGCAAYMAVSIHANAAFDCIVLTSVSLVSLCAHSPSVSIRPTLPTLPMISGLM
jgi:mitogen-activated protein kinase kinase 7